MADFRLQASGPSSLPEGGASICGMVASFGARSGTSTSHARVVGAVPAMAEAALRNGAEMQGAFCVAERGLVPLVDKARRAQQCGAACLVIVNSDDRPLIAHGHRRADGTEDAGRDITILVVVVPRSETMLRSGLWPSYAGRTAAEIHQGVY
jgi:hypothetical protein